MINSEIETLKKFRVYLFETITLAANKIKWIDERLSVLDSYELEADRDRP